MVPNEQPHPLKSAPDSISLEDIEHAIARLDSRDKVGVAGEVAATAGGLAAGMSAAGAVAGAAGATTILGSTTLASVFGGVLATTTPVGWIIGCAVAGGAAAYGIGRLIRSGARQDQVRNGIRQRLSKRLDAARLKLTGDVAGDRFREALRVAQERGLLGADQAHRIQLQVERGALEPGLATQRLQLLAATTDSDAPGS